MDCSVCKSEFDIEQEGGIEGYFGILPVAFCPTCYACMIDMIQIKQCSRCSKEVETLHNNLCEDCYDEDFSGCYGGGCLEQK